jgi:hypothetical protein
MEQKIVTVISIMVLVAFVRISFHRYYFPVALHVDNKQRPRSALLFLIAMLSMQICCLASGSRVIVGEKHYVLQLGLNEFSILNVSEMDGLQKYGGSGDFKLTMAREGSNVVWNVTVDNPRLMELLGIFVGEKTMKLVQSLDPNNLDPNQKLALEAIKSLSQKLEYAQNNPGWDSIKLPGMVVQQGTNWMFQTKDDTYKLVGAKLAETGTRNGKSIIADGFVKVPGEFELTSFIDKQTNTLELFVMSHCPYAQQAESKLIAFLSQTNLTSKPQLEVHYLFYKAQKDGKDVFGSPHGDDEVTEDLVQMAIRDIHPDHFLAYLRERVIHLDAAWKSLAEKAGLNAADITLMAKMTTDQRDSMVRGEYETMINRYGIVDASPSYFWEGEQVRDLNRVGVFKGLEQMKLETCSN